MMSDLYSLTCNCCKKEFRGRDGSAQLCETCAEYYLGITLSTAEIVRNEISAREQMTADRDELKHQVGLLKMERSIDQEEVTGHREAERLLALERDALKKELAVMKRALELSVNKLYKKIRQCPAELMIAKCAYNETTAKCEPNAKDHQCWTEYFTAKAREEQTPTRVICIQCHGCKSVDGKTPCELCGGKGYVELPKAREEE